MGVLNAIHFTSVRLSGFAMEPAFRFPAATAKESLRWQTIWWAVMRPHLRSVVAVRRARREWQSVRQLGSARVLIKRQVNPKSSRSAPNRIIQVGTA